MEVTPKTLTALAHSGQPPVARPLTPCEDLSIHTYSIITHADSEIGIAESHFDLNVAGLCMLVRVADRFACDTISLVTNDSSQLAGPALHAHAVLRPSRGINPRSEFRAECAQRSREITVIHGRGAQVLDGVASRADRLVSYLHGRVQELRGIVSPFGEQLPDGLQSKHQTLKSLQQGVVQLPRDPGPLVESFFHALFEPPAHR
jgi:hypothetical protein